MNITPSFNIWPVMLQNLGGEIINLDLPLTLKSGLLEAEIKTSNAGK
jgi:hypothetical protein